MPTDKGSYDETMTAAIAAFRATDAPHVLQVFESVPQRTISCFTKPLGLHGLWCVDNDHVGRASTSP